MWRRFRDFRELLGTETLHLSFESDRQSQRTGRLRTRFDHRSQCRSMDSSVARSILQQYRQKSLIAGAQQLRPGNHRLLPLESRVQPIGTIRIIASSFGHRFWLHRRPGACKTRRIGTTCRTQNYWNKTNRHCRQRIRNSQMVIELSPLQLGFCC